MADDLLTISDLVADKLDLSPAQISDLEQAVPFLNSLPMVEASNGTEHKYTKETGAPVVGFRAANAGRDMDHSVDTLVTLSLKILDWTWVVDKAVADAWQKGREMFIGREGLRHLRAALKKFESQIIYGDQAPGDTAGFAGMVDSSTVDAVADDRVVNAGGDTADSCSSVWMVRIGEDDIAGVYKGDGVAEVGETVVVERVVNPGTDNKTFPAYYTPGCSWVGVQVGGINSMARIANLDFDHPLTDDLLSQLLEVFPEDREPTHIVMNRHSRGQLQRSRTATNATGAEAPRPTDYEGIPIISTSSVLSTEAVLA